MKENATSELSVYRRSLPHWRLDGATYFVTWRVFPEQEDLSAVERDETANALFHFNGERYDLLCFVVMNDHVHAILKPYETHRVETLLHSWKSFLARQFQVRFGRVGKVWQAEYFDRIIRDEPELREKVEYIFGNPAKRWPEIEDYRWVWGWWLKEAGTEARPTANNEGQ